MRLDALLVRGQSTKGSRIFPHETLRQEGRAICCASLAGAAMVRCHTRSNFLSDAGGL